MPGRIRPIPMATDATKSGLDTSAVLGNMIDQMTPATTKIVPITALTADGVFIIISFFIALTARGWASDAFLVLA